MLWRFQNPERPGWGASRTTRALRPDGGSARTSKIHSNVFHFFRKFKYVAGQDGIFLLELMYDGYQEIDIVPRHSIRHGWNSWSRRQFFPNRFETSRVTHTMPPSEIMKKAYHFALHPDSKGLA